MSRASLQIWRCQLFTTLLGGVNQGERALQFGLKVSCNSQRHSGHQTISTLRLKRSLLSKGPATCSKTRFSVETQEQQQLGCTHSCPLPMGGAWQHIPRTSLWFEETEVTRLSSCFLGVFSQALGTQARLHSRTVFWKRCLFTVLPSSNLL